MSSKRAWVDISSGFGGVRLTKSEPIKKIPVITERAESINLYNLFFLIRNSGLTIGSRIIEIGGLIAQACSVGEVKFKMDKCGNDLKVLVVEGYGSDLLKL